MQANMWFEHKAEKASKVNGAGEEELERSLQKVLPDALMQALQRMRANTFDKKQPDTPQWPKMYMKCTKSRNL